jgi:CrcB protein
MTGLVIWLYIGLAGALGTLVRYAVARLGVAIPAWQAFPWWTLGVNLVGSACLGFLYVWGEGKTFFGEDLRLVLGTGMMGGLTTYSTFNLEALRMIEEGQAARAAAYVMTTVALALAAGYAGLTLARALR